MPIQTAFPRWVTAVIAGNKFFIVLQRLDRDAGWVFTNTSYVAVFDTNTDTEIDTGADETPMLGIPLDIKNPQAIQYQGDNNIIYVQGAGKLEDTWERHSGGIQWWNRYYQSQYLRNHDAR